MRASLLAFAALAAATGAAAQVPLPAGAKLRIGDPNALRAIDGSFAFAPDGKALYVLETRSSVRAWNLADGTRGRAVKGPTVSYIFAASPDGRWLAAREAFTTVRLWNVATGAKERAWTTTGQAGRMAFTADSKYLVGVQEGKDFRDPSSLVVWDVAADAPVRSFPVGAGKDPRVSSFALSPDGKRAAVVGNDLGPVRVFELGSGKEVAAVGKAAGFGGSQALAFKGTSSLLVAFGNALSEFDLARPDAPPAVTRYARAVEALAPDGSRVAVSTPNFGQFEIWDVGAAGPRKTVGVPHATSRSGLGFSSDGKAFVLVTGGQYAPPRVWDTTTGAELFPNPGHPMPVQALAVIEGGKTLASGAADGQLRFWDLPTGAAKGPTGLMATHLELSADGGRLLTASGSGAGSLGNVKVYETAPLKVIAGFQEGGKAVALSPDGKTVAVGTKGAIRVLDVDQEKVVAEEDFAPELVGARGLAFGPDGKRLLAQPFNGLLVFDALGMKKAKGGVFVETRGFVRSPDGKQLAAVRGNPERVSVLDATTGREVASYKTPAPGALAWSRDGKWVGTADGATLHVWSAAGGKLRLKRIGHDADITAIAFAPDGKTVFSGGNDNLVYGWELPAP